MKSHTLICLLGCALTHSVAKAETQDSDVTGLLEKVEVPKEKDSPDDYLISLSRVSNINFIADTTQPFSDNARPFIDPTQPTGAMGKRNNTTLNRQLILLKNTV